MDFLLIVNYVCGIYPNTTAIVFVSTRISVGTEFLVSA